MSGVVCIHDGTRMLSNPFSNGELYWCPKCNGHSYRSAKTARFEKAVMAKLLAEGLTLSSPWSEIEQCLSQCVAGKRCVAVARKMVERNA